MERIYIIRCDDFLVSSFNENFAIHNLKQNLVIYLK